MLLFTTVFLIDPYPGVSVDLIPKIDNDNSNFVEAVREKREAMRCQKDKECQLLVGENYVCRERTNICVVDNAKADYQLVYTGRVRLVKQKNQHSEGAKNNNP